MNLLSRIRAWLRQWLGLDALPTSEMLNNLELREKQRHEALMGMLNRIEQRMINTHVGAPRNFAPSVLDWDTVQAMALIEMEKNPPKES